MVEVLNVGAVFFGLGIMVFFCVISYALYQLSRHLKNSADLEEKYTLVEELNLDRVAERHGFDLAKETLKRQLFKNKKYSLRKKLEQEIYEEMFGKVEEGTAAVKGKKK